jgi:GTP pyrophosphokinase
MAHRLGVAWIKSELESRTQVFAPEIYYQLKRNVAKKRRIAKSTSAKSFPSLKENLKRRNRGGGHGPSEAFFQYLPKMESQNLLYDQIYDLVAFRILVDTVRMLRDAGRDPFQWRGTRAVQRLHRLPPNMYQSLHTSVIGPYGERIEIQIRTHEMHRVAERGCAHWRYKDGADFQVNDNQRFAWLRQC